MLFFFFFVFMFYDTLMPPDQLVDKQNLLLWRLKKKNITGMQSKFRKRRATGYKMVNKGNSWTFFYHLIWVA